jgi:hypothetical protein
MNVGKNKLMVFLKKSVVPLILGISSGFRVLKVYSVSVDFYE